MQLSILTRLFKKYKFYVKTTKNGHEAFLEVEKIIKMEMQFDIILLDLDMPITNGYKACELIKNLYERGNV